MREGSCRLLRQRRVPVSGSAELETQLIVSGNLKYIGEKELDEAKEKIAELNRLLHPLINNYRLETEN